MKAWAVKLYEDVRSSYWFIPVLMSSLAILLSFGTVAIDERFSVRVFQSLGFVWSGGPDGARGLLSAIASSMITVASLTFSLTTVAFSQASSLFGPLLLKNYLRDRRNQAVLGTLVATFLYALLVLRTIRSGDETQFVPYVSVSTSLLLSTASLLVLIYFIHHVGQSIYAPYVIARVAQDLIEFIDHNYEKKGEHSSSTPEAVESEVYPGDRMDWLDVRLSSSNGGYLSAIDYDQLMKVACENDLLIRIRPRPGHFLIQDERLVQIGPGENARNHLAQRIEDAFYIDVQRTDHQDVEFAVDQLVGIAARALSPGINDPFTAMICIDWLALVLAHLARMQLPSPYRYDEDGHLRIIHQHPVTFSGVLEAAFNQIRQNSRDNVAVTIRLLEALEKIYDRVDGQADRQAVLRQANLILEASRTERIDAEDRKDIQERYHDLAFVKND